jgi:hypothetical protein
MIHHTQDDRPEREPSNLFDPEVYFTQQEIEVYFREVHEELEGGSGC